ncbi:hypothetical protein RhiJN_12338 [Ceratobasidium sp. AG-Ba]|nr:hypothetical protein RhiJN_12338 [Ceratobasidium sp. AG-Ba]
MLVGLLGLTYIVCIKIDEETGDITGYIDFERTIVAPLWPCATVPQWIPNPRGGMAKWYGGTPEEQEQIWATFYTAEQHDRNLTGGEWRKAYELGKSFRIFADRLALDIPCWDDRDMENFILTGLKWAREHPGIGMPVDDYEFHSMR